MFLKRLLAEFCKQITVQWPVGYNYHSHWLVTSMQIKNRYDSKHFSSKRLIFQLTKNQTNTRSKNYLNSEKIS